MNLARRITHRYEETGIRGLADSLAGMSGRLLRRPNALIRWYACYVLNPRKRTGQPTLSYESAIGAFNDASIEVRRTRIDVAQYRAYLQAADYPGTYYAGPLRSILPEKTLEHFLSLQSLDLAPEMTVVDVASHDSPFPDIVQRLYGCRVFHQDLEYPPGVHGDRIGSNADALPLPDESVDFMTAHCSFEHFENDSDTGFAREADRVLKPGGTLCIVPLYLADKATIILDPFRDLSGIIVDLETSASYMRNFVGGRFSRRYDVSSFARRVLGAAPSLTPTVIFIENPELVDPGCYVRFVCLLSKGRGR